MYASAEQLPNIQNENFDKELRQRNDTVTWLAETLNGSMRSNVEFQFDGEELYAEDGSSIGEVFNSAITHAKLFTESNPSLLFELRRRLVEYGEYQEMLGMARGELPNTMVVVSDFPEELQSNSKDVGGYNVSRHQTMLRVITRKPDGEIRITTQSLDGSNRAALESIYQKLGQTPDRGELLGQRIHLELPKEWQDQLTDNLRQQYDDTLSGIFGGGWHAGIRFDGNEKIQDTTSFVQSQTELIDWFVNAKINYGDQAEALRYSLAATISARFESGNMISVEEATRNAINEGRTFSGCGISASSSGDSTAESQLSDSGYGNKEKECEFNSKECPECHKKNVRTKSKEINGKTHVSGSCGCYKIYS